MKRAAQVLSALLVTVVCALAACGGDSTGPGLPNVNGSWTLTLTNVSGSGISCNSSGTTMNLIQAGATFSGSYSGGSITCLGGGQSFTSPLGSGSVINGAIDGQRVTFDIDSPDFALTGTISGGSMSGTVTLREDLGAPYGVITLSGNWGAGKRP